MAGMWLRWLIATVVIAAVAWAVVRSTSSNSGEAAKSAGDVLKRRYAAGEIDEEEYDKRRRSLRQ